MNIRITFSVPFILILGLCACFSSSEVHDVVIVSGGLMGVQRLGSWLRKVNQFCIEQQDSIYTFGSSQGEARIARSLGVKGDIFSYLHNRTGGFGVRAG